jgi:hypothetical protein
MVSITTERITHISAGKVLEFATNMRQIIGKEGLLNV